MYKVVQLRMIKLALVAGRLHLRELEEGRKRCYVRKLSVYAPEGGGGTVIADSTKKKKLKYSPIKLDSRKTKNRNAREDKCYYVT